MGEYKVRGDRNAVLISTMSPHRSDIEPFFFDVRDVRVDIRLWPQELLLLELCVEGFKVLDVGFRHLGLYGNRVVWFRIWCVMLDWGG